MIIVTKQKSYELYDAYNLNHYFNSYHAILLYDTRNRQTKDLIPGIRLEQNINKILDTLPLSKRYN